jgi:site-specific recombinase XerD
MIRPNSNTSDYVHIVGPKAVLVKPKEATRGRKAPEEAAGSSPRRHHWHESSLQKAIKGAARLAGITKPVGPNTLRRCFAAHLLEAHHDIRTVQEPLGHKDVKTTMIYTHVLNRGGLAVHSPLD